MMVEFKEGERKRTIHKMELSHIACSCILQFGTIKIGDDNYEIINAHLNNLGMFGWVYDSDNSLLPDAEIYVQKA